MSEDDKQESREGIDGSSQTSRQHLHSLPRRTFTDASSEMRNDGVHILLDGKPAKTPAGVALILPTEKLANRIAEEWASQKEVIDFESMPLTGLASFALGDVIGREEEIIDEILSYAGTDLICYRAEGPQELIMKQMAAWDPVLNWATQAMRVPFKVAAGVMPVEQSAETLTQVKSALSTFNGFALTSLHTMTTLTGSALLSLAHISGLLDLQATWQAAHLDEDWQISKWGEDSKAKHRLERRWRDMEAASRFFKLLNIG